MTIHFFATAARGTESALAEELRETGLSGVRIGSAGVHFRGDWPDGWRACLHSRIASTIVARMAEGEAATPEALYERVRSVDWSPFLSPHHTLAVSAVCRDSRMKHSGFVALRTKDAVVDQFRDRFGARPSVDRDDPDVRLFVRLVQNRVLIGLDLAGTALHRRGYRAGAGAAPLRETLAAAILRLSGWNRTVPLLDPMCGSGTLAIEGALWAMNRAPGLRRDRFGFERWVMHDAEAELRMAGLREEARAGEHISPVEVVAGDVDGKILDHARASAALAGVGIRFYRGAVEHAMPRFPGPAMIVTNPPYGQRMANPDALYAALAQAFCERHGDTVTLLSGNPALEHAMNRAPEQRRELRNGDLPCRLLIYRC